MKAKGPEACTKRRAWKRVAGRIFSLVFFAAMVVLLIDFVRRARPRDLLGWALFMLGMIALAFLSHKFKFIERTIARLFAAYFIFLGWMFITLVPLTLFNWLSQIILEKLTVGFQVIVFAAWGLLLTLAVRLIATSSLR